MPNDVANTKALAEIAEGEYAPIEQDAASTASSPTREIAFHYSMSGLLKLFVLIALLMAVISEMPWLALPIVPITIVGLRTYQVAKHRRLAGRPLSMSEGMEIATSTLVITVMCCLSLLVAGLVAYHLGSLGQAMMFGNSFDLMAGGLLLAMLSVGGLGYAWFKTIRKNWAYDMQGIRSAEPLAAVVAPPRHFQFGLATIFELTTLVAIFVVLIPNVPALAVALAGPFIAAMIYTARHANQQIDNGEVVTVGARYGFFLRAFAISVVLLVTFADVLGVGWAVVGLIAYEFTGNAETSLALGALAGTSLAAAFAIAAWYLRLPQLLNKANAGSKASAEAVE